MHTMKVIQDRVTFHDAKKYLLSTQQIKIEPVICVGKVLPYQKKMPQVFYFILSKSSLFIQVSARVGTRDCSKLKKSGDCKTVKVGTQSDPDHLLVLFRKCPGGHIIAMKVSHMPETLCFHIHPY